jgi:hypothetical protein
VVDSGHDGKLHDWLRDEAHVPARFIAGTLQRLEEHEVDGVDDLHELAESPAFDICFKGVTAAKVRAALVRRVASRVAAGPIEMLLTPSTAAGTAAGTGSVTPAGVGASVPEDASSEASVAAAASALQALTIGFLARRHLSTAGGAAVVLQARARVLLARRRLGLQRSIRRGLEWEAGIDAEARAARWRRMAAVLRRLAALGLDERWHLATVRIQAALRRHWAQLQAAEMQRRRTAAAAKAATPQAQAAAHRKGRRARNKANRRARQAAADASSSSGGGSTGWAGKLTNNNLATPSTPSVHSPTTNAEAVAARWALLVTLFLTEPVGIGSLRWVFKRRLASDWRCEKWLHGYDDSAKGFVWDTYRLSRDEPGFDAAMYPPPDPSTDPWEHRIQRPHVFPPAHLYDGFEWHLNPGASPHALQRWRKHIDELKAQADAEEDPVDRYYEHYGDSGLGPPQEWWDRFYGGASSDDEEEEDLSALRGVAGPYAGCLNQLLRPGDA